MVGTLILLLLAVNALYVAAEFGAVSARRTRIRLLAEQGHPLATQLRPIVEDPQKLDRYLATSQIGITLATLALGAYSQATLAKGLAPALMRWSHLSPEAVASASSLVVLIGLTAVQVVVAELVPKALALQFPTRTALYTLLPMRWSALAYTYTGFLALLHGSGLAILRLLGIPPVSHRHIHRPEEIDLLIAESAQGGLLEPVEQTRLRRSLRLGDLTVRQVMTPRVYIRAVDAEASADEFLRAVLDSGFTRLPVYRGSVDHVVGMVNVKDVVHCYVETGRVPTVREAMRPAVFVPESMRADDVLRVFRERHSQQAVVGDELGGVAGLITLEDVLEEVLGEISDDAESIGQPEPERLADGRVRLPGLMRLDEAEAWLGVRWQGAADTVAGLVIQALGHLPQAGERVTIDGVGVEVEKVAHHTVSAIIATPAPAAGEQRDD